MTVNLKPEVQKYVEAQLKAGRYESAEDVVEDALARMMEEDAWELDAQTLAAIDESEEQIERGQYRDWKDVSAQLRAKFLRK